MFFASGGLSAVAFGGVLMGQFMRSWLPVGQNRKAAIHGGLSFNGDEIYFTCLILFLLEQPTGDSALAMFILGYFLPKNASRQALDAGREYGGTLLNQSVNRGLDFIYTLEQCWLLRLH